MEERDRNNRLLLMLIDAAVALLYVMVAGGARIFLWLLTGMPETLEVERLGYELWQLVLLVPFFLGIAYLSIVLHEAGHFLMGKIVGFRLSFIGAGGLAIVRGEDGKLHGKKLRIAGAGGFCAMRSGQTPGKTALFFYLTGGVFMNALQCLAFTALFLFAGSQYSMLVCIMGGLLNLILLLHNALPFYSSAFENDGRKLLFLLRSDRVRQAYAKLDQIEYLQILDRTYAEMPEEWFEHPAAWEMQCRIETTVAVVRCLRLMETGKNAEAEKEMDELLRSGADLGLFPTITLLSRRIVLELLKDSPDYALCDALRAEAEKHRVCRYTAHRDALCMRYVWAVLREKNALEEGRCLMLFEQLVQKTTDKRDVDLLRGYMQTARQKSVVSRRQDPPAAQ